MIISSNLDRILNLQQEIFKPHVDICIRSGVIVKRIFKDELIKVTGSVDNHVRWELHSYYILVIVFRDKNIYRLCQPIAFLCFY